MRAKVITWVEPNRANTPPLHIADRGDRFSTLTGVAWIDEQRFLVNHRSGLRMALFDRRAGSTPLVIASIPHLTDDIAVKQIAPQAWEVAVSGCWACAYSIFHLTIGDTPKLQLMQSRKYPDKTFCHGVAYDSEGTLCLGLHTGDNPRIEIGTKCWKLPAPWGARDICFDKVSKNYYAVAVSKNPNLLSYNRTSTGIWSYLSKKDQWENIAMMDDVHSDTCQIYKGRIWLPDQLGDRILGIDLAGKKPPHVIKGAGFDFPHGLDISNDGLLAVTNYGSSSVTILNLADFD